MNLPFWVRLAASPEEKAPSYLLKKVTPGSTVDSLEYNEEGIQLEISGRQFIRWFNYVTKDTVLLKFDADGGIPSTKETMSGAPIFTEGNRTFYGRGLTGAISSSDPGSGVEETYVSIDGKKFESYRSELKFSIEKDYSLRFYAVDNVGNVSQPSSLNFTVDLTPPSTRHEIIDRHLGTTLQSTTAIRLSGSDALSGFKIFYRFDTQTEDVVYRGTDLSLDHLSDGEHKLVYYGIDNVENKGNTTEFSFYFDKTSPLTAYTIDGDQYLAAGKTYVSPRTRIAFSATDNKIGVDRIEYAINSTSYAEYTAPFPALIDAAESAIKYRAVDRLENASSAKDLPVWMDKAAPQSSHEFIGPSSKRSGEIWITSKTQISLSAADDGAGVNSIYSKVDLQPHNKHSAPIIVANEGRYEFEFWSIDNVNNREENQELILRVDNTPPEIVEIFSVWSTGSAKDESGAAMGVFPRDTSIFLASRDASASTEGIWYAINGGQEKEYVTPLVFPDEGTFTVAIRSKDKVDNTSNKTLKFVIKD